jgi:hypothetical protein
MTRKERLAQAAERAKAKLASDRKSLQQVEAQQREEDRRQRNRRRYAVGTLADAAGLCALGDEDLMELFGLLASLAEGPSPKAVLASLLSDSAGPALETVDGMARPWQDGGGPYRANEVVAR